MRNNTLMKKITRRILPGLISFCLLPTLIWLLPVVPQAIASEQAASFLPEATFTIARNPVEEGLDKLDREAAQYKAEGATDEVIGKTQRAVGKVTGQTEGALKQAEGQAEQAVGNTKDSISGAGDKAEDASESLIDKIKNIFD